MLALLFALSGVGRLPERRAEPAEIARVTATQPERARPARRSIVRALAAAAVTPRPRRSVATTVAARPPRSSRARFVSRLYLRHRALLI